MFKIPFNYLEIEPIVCSKRRVYHLELTMALSAVVSDNGNSSTFYYYKHYNSKMRFNGISWDFFTRGPLFQDRYYTKSRLPYLVAAVFNSRKG